VYPIKKKELILFFFALSSLCLVDWMGALYRNQGASELLREAVAVIAMALYTLSVGEIAIVKFGQTVYALSSLFLCFRDATKIVNTTVTTEDFVVTIVVYFYFHSYLCIIMLFVIVG
jgi:hypothetical protein